MLKIVIKNLIRRLNAHNTCCITGVKDHYNESEINLLIDMLKEFRVKVAISSVNPYNQNVIANVVDHASHRIAYGWASWKYTGVCFDFHKITKDGDEFERLIRSLSDLNLEWTNATNAVCKLY